MKWTVAPAEAHTRLDRFIAHHAACSAGEARRLIDAGLVRVNGRRAKKGVLLNLGAEVALERPPPTAEERRPRPEPERPLQVLHQDPALVVVDKPAGWPTHPLRVGETGTLANALVARFPECAGVTDDPREGGAAHRLDTDTSGVLVAARTREAWLALRAAFGAGRIEKAYLALVGGNPPDEGEVNAALAHADARRVRAVDEWAAEDGAHGARPARTRFRVVARTSGAALVLATTTTGRMHQVRAHLAHAGAPLLGDTLYGGAPLPGGGRHLLHALRVTLPHPTDGRTVTFTAPLPADRLPQLVTLLGPADAWALQS